ncbi:MAG: ELWxxDGT repeat protein, partial [Planctomycetota bacterium]
MLEQLETRNLLATITVTSLADDTIDDGQTTLREAILEAESDPSSEDVIQFDDALVSSGDATIDLSLFDPGIDDGEFGPTAFQITSTITIVGPNGENGIRINRPSTSSEFRLFLVTTTGILTFENVTLSGGVARGAFGASGSGGGGGGAGLGGGILNQGTLTVRSSTLTGHSAIGGLGSSGSGANLGGGGGGGAASDGFPGTNPNGGIGGRPNGGAANASGLDGGDGGSGGGGAGGTRDGSGSSGGDGGAGGFAGGGGGGGRVFGDNSSGGTGGSGGFGGGGGGGGLSSCGGLCISSPGTGGAGGFGAGSGAAAIFSTNVTGGGGGGGLGAGGAIFNYFGTLQMTTSTISGNSAIGGTANGTIRAGEAGDGLGGGVFSLNGDFFSTNNTIAANTVIGGASSGGDGSADGGAIYSLGDGASVFVSIALNNTLLADSTGGNDIVVSSINGATNSSSGISNLIESAVGFNGFGTVTADPALGALGDNGGPTNTHAIAENSVAVDGGDNDIAEPEGLTLDQRGQSLFQDGDADGVMTVDIGSFELQDAAPTFSAPRRGNADEIALLGSEVAWDILFSEPVSGVDASDFQVNQTVASVTLGDAGDSDESTYVLTVSGATAGTLQISQLVDDSGITDIGGTEADPTRQGELSLHAYQIAGADFGDAPDLAPGTASGDYETLLANDGPRHVIDPNLFLGAAAPDADIDAFGDGTDGGTSLFDLNPTGSASPFFFTNVNGTLFFRANDGINGVELWKSDGTREGTVQVADINSGSLSSSPSNLTNVNGTLFFRATDGSNGFELWKSDGTEEGTVQVRDIRPGSNSSSPSYLAESNGRLFFRANDGTNGTEIWTSDGTEDGTIQLADIRSGASSSFPYELTNVNGTLFFQANDGANGRELWKSDGTVGGTEIVKDIRPGSNAGFPNDFVNLNGELFFHANDGTNGRELWKSDGTEEGTVQLVDIQPGGDAYVYGLYNSAGTLFFSANDGTNGEELWKSDGTEEGTVLVANIDDGRGDSRPMVLGEANGITYFTPNALAEQELWRTDGTEAGTFELEINPTNGSFPSRGANVNGTFFFQANDGTNGREVWKTDGSLAGTELLQDIGTTSVGPNGFTNFNGTLVFSHNDGINGTEPYFSDGTGLNGDAGDDDRDGATPDDEDGLIDESADLVIVDGQIPIIEMLVTNNTGSQATLLGWIDYDNDGVFEPSESASVAVETGTTAGTATLEFPQVSVQSAGQTFARFRLTTDASITTATPGGFAADGEVEDYLVTVAELDFGDAPDLGSGTGVADYETTLANDGPRHAINQNLFLGDAAPDAEVDAFGVDSGVDETLIDTAEFLGVQPDVAQVGTEVTFEATVGGTIESLVLSGTMTEIVTAAFASEVRVSITDPNGNTISNVGLSSTNGFVDSLGFSTVVDLDAVVVEAGDVWTFSFIDTFDDDPVGEADITLDLTVDFLTADPASLESNFGSFTLNQGFYARLGSGDADHPFVEVPFQVGSDGFYDIQATWDGFDGFLFLFDSPFTGTDTTNIGSDDDGPGGTSDSLINDVQLLTGVTYYALLTTFSGDAGNTSNVGSLSLISDVGQSAFANFDATFDDLNGATPDDEEGILDEQDLIIDNGAAPSVEVLVTNNTGRDATLLGWIDYDNDGEFEPSESTSVIVPDGTTAGTATLDFPEVVVDHTGPTFARFRLTTDTSITSATPGGFAADGEVEDYVVSVVELDFGDAPDIAPGSAAGDYETLRSNDGPRHILGSSLFLGTAPDAESIPDDNDTDDGVVDTVDLAIRPNEAVSIEVLVTNNTGSDATVVGWIDYDNDGVFEVAESASASVASGSTDVTVSLLFPDSPLDFDQDVFARFRLSTDASLNSTTPTGLMSDGEVEDYLVTALSPDVERLSLRNINSGIAATDDATGTGFILYSAEDVKTRFSPLNADNSDHLIAARYRNGQWFVDTNQGQRAFVPVNSDRLIASVDFDADTISSLEATDADIFGIPAGFVTSDATFTADLFAGNVNDGEFTVDGTFIDVIVEDRFSVGEIKSGVAVADDASGT